MDTAAVAPADAAFIAWLDTEIRTSLARSVPDVPTAEHARFALLMPYRPASATRDDELPN